MPLQYLLLICGSHRSGFHVDRSESTREPCQRYNANDFFAYLKCKAGELLNKKVSGLFGVESADVIFSHVVTMLTWHADVA